MPARKLFARQKPYVSQKRRQFRRAVDSTKRGIIASPLKSPPTAISALSFYQPHREALPLTSTATMDATTSPSNALAETENPVSHIEGGDSALQPLKKTKKIIRRRKKPARVQVDPATVKSEPPPQTGELWNIWYSKWSGGDSQDKHGLDQPAPHRCNVARDSGYTKADQVPGSYFCLYFSKGQCWKGPACEYLHRIPTIHDHFNPSVDAFGRDKHQDYR